MRPVSWLSTFLVPACTRSMRHTSVNMPSMSSRPASSASSISARVGAIVGHPHSDRLHGATLAAGRAQQVAQTLLLAGGDEHAGLLAPAAGEPDGLLPVVD